MGLLLRIPLTLILVLAVAITGLIILGRQEILASATGAVRPASWPSI